MYMKMLYNVVYHVLLSIKAEVLCLFVWFLFVCFVKYLTSISSVVMEKFENILSR